MSSIQQRLLQREPLDNWSVREQLCLASAVSRCGDQNWMSVSRALRAAGDPSRPPDWYQQKSCAAQYGVLLEAAETPKRKKRTGDAAAVGESPQDVILKKLTADRIAELQKVMADYKTQYAVLKEETAEVRSSATSEARVREMLAGVDAARRQREREQQRHAAWLREREERRLRAEKTRRPAINPPGGGLSPPASSPLLTSLLKNTSPGAPAPTPVVTQMLHIPHPSTVIDTVSPSAGAPTLSMLLERGREAGAAPPLPPAAAPPPPSSTDAAVIEQIKSELQEIEHTLRMGNIPSTSSPVGLAARALPAAPAPPPRDKSPPAPDKGPSLDIDDIEIKAEDVYAFSDMDLEIQPVSSIHKNSLTRTLEKSAFNKKGEPDEAPALEEDSPPPPQDNLPELEIKEEVPETAPTAEAAEPAAEPQPLAVSDVEPARENTPVEYHLELSIPTIPLPDDTPPETPAGAAEAAAEAAAGAGAAGAEGRDPSVVKEEDVEPAAVHSEQTNDELPPAELTAPAAEPPAVTAAEEEAPRVDDEGRLQETAPVEETAEQQTVPEPVQESEVVKLEVTPEVKSEEGEGLGEGEGSSEHEIAVKKEEPEWEEVAGGAKGPEVAGEAGEAGAGAEEKRGDEAEETHTETDDDTPMEVIREEDTGGRKRRDYSRRKAPPPTDSRACSGSESAAETSAPPSPAAAPRAAAAATPDPDRDHRLWKKSVMLVYNRLCAHKYASLFLRPITDELAPDYSLVVRRPMDLTTIKRNIDSGVIRTTAEFQRDVLLMLSNALFYNNSRHRVHLMAQEMHQEAAAQLGMLLQAQAHAALADSHAEPPARRSLPHGKRKRTSSPHLQPTGSPAAKRPRDD